ncbi:hypothetical protein [Shewanella woodyi]|uniref:hypothetical protein n=1 Tax=Shewanella woodyi TaxID=60961 RepID=UPI0007EB5972|nr:hypothetical protein [Shewanella woodyi]
MTEETISLHSLSHFASLFEIAVGINLVFAFWNSLHNAAIKNFTCISEGLSTTLRGAIGDTYVDSRTSLDFEELKVSFLQNLKLLSAIAKWAGLISTISMISLLIFIGFNQDYMVSTTIMYFIIFIAVCTSPLFIFMGNSYVSYAEKRLTTFSDTHLRAVMDVKKILV